jgi:hypothetical protein
MITGFRSQQMREDDTGTHRGAGRQPQQGQGGIKYFALAAAITLSPLLAAVPAAARPQDEVLSAAFKCAAIADLRTWLDCYYGAAQPQRAALGLPAVPAAQARLVASPPSGSPPAGEIELRDDVLRAALECNRKAAGRDWLTCFYAAAEPARARLGLGSRTLANTVARVAPPPLPSNFGLRPKPEKTDESVSARMAAYAFDKGHLFTVTLDNGEVWQQLAGDDRVADWNKPASAYTVVISRGLFGSYNFRVVKSGSLFKVRRLR